MSAPTQAQPGPRNRGIFVIAVFKVIHGVLLLAVSIGMLHLLHRDIRHVAEQMINRVRVDPDNKYVAALMAKLGLIDDRHLKELGGLTAIYAGLFLTEGAGLLFRKRWAEYLTVIATGSLIPLEVYEIARHCTASRVALATVNVAIVVYLVVQLRTKKAK